MTKSTSAQLKQTKEVVVAAKPFNTRLELYAEDHIYFDVKKPSIGSSFSELGLQPFAKAPSKGFIPDLSKLARAADGPRLFSLLGEMSASMNASQLRLLSVVFNNMAKLEAHGFQFGQKVYINVSSPRIEYVECYVEAVIIGVESEHPESPVYLSVDFDKMSPDSPMFWSMPTESFLTARQFRLHKKKLKSEEKVKVPEKIRKDHLCWERDSFGKPSNALSVDETVQTMDTVSADWLNNNVLDVLDPYVDPASLEEVDVVEEAEERPKKASRGRRKEDNVTLSQTRVKMSGAAKMRDGKVTFTH